MSEAGAGATRRRGAWALLLVAAALHGCVPLDDFLGDVFGRSMRDQRSFDPYEHTLLPPEGSVPISAGNYAAGPHQVNVGQPEGALDVPPPFAQEDLTARRHVVDRLVNPVPATQRSLARGEELYERVCVVCHGPDGAGTTGYIFEVHPAMVAYPLQGETAKGHSDGYLYAIIRVGRGLMPAYGHQIGHYDRWHIVNYVRRLQGLATVVAPEPESEPAVDEAAAGADGGGHDADSEHDRDEAHEEGS